MNENGKKKREWVKTAAIIFLSVMLVLTFFSNTIMNYSLPEVATQYVESGTITAKIRGSGVVESGNPYNVEVTESRKVSQVAVKVGDQVEKDDVLLYLEDAESTELKEARTQLDSLKAEYDRAIVTADTSSSIVNKVENGNVTSTESKVAQIDAYNNRIDALQNNIDAYNNRIAEIDAELDKLGDNTVDTSGEQQAVNNAQAELDKATAWIGTAKEKLEAAQSVLESVNSAVKVAEDNQAACETALENAKTERSEREKSKKDLEDMAKLGDLSAEDQARLIRLSGEGEGSVKEAQVAEENAYVALENAKQAVINAGNSIEGDRAIAQNAVNEAQTEYDNALTAKTTWEGNLADAQRNLANKQASKPDNSYRDALNNEKADLSLNLSKATTEKADVEKELTELLAGFTKEVDLVELLGKIRDQEDLVKELTEKSIGATITAPVAGTVTSLSVVAGESTEPGTPVAVLQPAGKGFSMSFSVTNEQAKRLSVGDVADLVNAWRYDDLKVTLANIKPDPSEPGQKKLLTFDVDGDVTAGQTLNVSVGQKSANYDLIVPNSAIREDNNGKFILIVESKPGPLNTRYIATRVDVEVLASDDTQSAISAALYGYEFVITTSTKPVEAGKQVRLAEG
ncbi:HlyD family efflux transporter periplasmic adaptor subunit [Acetatifactor aquisgranensis]|uniref:HlyD family efflux transporter periplasmic adaptor subunit n=1 Tax=Acetatifactor aquisgranensis TaxID=2941233 RepID=UPI00203CD3A3|nr:HlyD family efflux transporter periplasmic adaptor subunit [Acetatifactor aquisgranensis]